MKNNGTDFKKPYAKDFFGIEHIGYYPYPREELIKNPIFPYFVLDGGAFNLMNDRFGSADSQKILELTLSGELFEIFKYKEKFNWEASFAYTKDTDFRKKYEWQIWPQRLYFTIPLAHKFLQTGDEKFAFAWLTIIKEWDKAHPYQEFDPDVSYFDTDMVWRDMQPAWRTMSLLHGIFMLQDAPFSKEDWKYLYDFTELHIKHLYLEAIDRLKRNHAQNHVLQIGVVLLFAVSMFPEFENTKEMTKIGLDTVRMNLENAIFSDGGSDEDSPSYSHFIARLYLEALLLIDKNGYEEIPGLRESVKKQYEWLYSCMTPNGKTLQLSDSYALDVMQDIKFASKLIELDFDKTQRSVYFPDSHIVVIRKGKQVVFIDAASFPAHHHHAGSPQIISYYDTHPILVDTGVCNYDRWEMYYYLHNFKAHNVVYNDEFDDCFDCRVTARFTKVDLEEGVVSIETKVCHKDGKSYVWTRDIKVTENSIDIYDKAASEIQMPFKSRLFFAKNDVYFPEGNKNTMQLLKQDFLMTLNSKKAVNMELAPVMNEKNEPDYAVVCQSGKVTDCFENELSISFSER